MKDHFKQVLFVSPHYGLRGGMASVLQVYSKNIQHFNYLPTYYNKNTFLNLLHFTKALAKLIWIIISNHQIKIVHIHTASRGSFVRKSVIALFSKLFQKKVVLHIHGGEFKEYYRKAGFLKNYIRHILKTVDEVIVLSDEWKIYFDSLIGQQKSIIVNNPVVIPASITPKPIEYPIKVLFLNHIDPRKGIFDLADFFRDNKAWLQDSFELLVAGAGDLGKLKKFIAENDLTKLIKYKGWVSGKDKEHLIEESDLFILTSYNEGLPVSILEAMAYSKPIIATNVGGIPRIVKPGENGWLVKPADKDSLLDIFRQVKSDKDILVKYGQRSFQIAQDYSPVKVNEKLGRIYDDLLTPNLKKLNNNYEKAQ